MSAWIALGVVAVVLFVGIGLGMACEPDKKKRRDSNGYVVPGDSSCDSSDGGSCGE